ncbi:MAG TPA: class I SAM-dependent methyltransferase [Chitinophagales bacterium]|nr:class I SAM-dependent methyltransferase [Chitinophagales bacterium]
MMLKDKLRLAADYVRFRLHARSRYTIHSPFLFELVNDVLRDKRHFYAFDEIEKIREQLLADNTRIRENHYGEPSKALPESRRMSDITRVAALPARYGKLLFRLVNHLRPAGILELGTGTGISTLYLASASTNVPVISLEASPVLGEKARQQAARMRLNNVRIITGNFTDTLEEALRQLPQPLFVFIDGDHNKAHLLHYLERLLPFTKPDSTIVIDDIYWSEEMKHAWCEIIRLPQVTMSVDMFRLGILFFRKGMVKQHVKAVI